uniref:S100/CaBP-9k-type calcium binding subdomain domain-containing protein n=1 Tax=Periophthalmus magnuspinnatus TaxID=409849 RepID=A0A3B4A3I8_9GOBI
MHFQRPSMTELESALNSLVQVFQQHCASEEEPPRLRRSQLKGLLHDQLPHLMEHASDQASLDSLMDSLDHDGDAHCDFNHFVTLLSSVTVCCHEFFQHHHGPRDKCGPPPLFLWPSTG